MTNNNIDSGEKCNELFHHLEQTRKMGDKDDLQTHEENKHGSPTIDGLESPHKDNLKHKVRIQRRNGRYYFQHPYSRLFVAYFVVFCNFLIYAEDPVSHSRANCTIPVVGNDFAFVTYRYPPGGWSVLKVFLWLVAIIVGVLVGKFFFHKLVFNRWMKLSMFYQDRGSWMVMFLTTLVSLFIFSFLYNGFLSAGGDEVSVYKVTTYLGIQNDSFMKAAALGTWTGDFVTAWMVTDMMLQDKLYPNWNVKLRKIWKTGWTRIYLFWIVWIVATVIVATGIVSDFVKWDTLNRDFVSTNELSRAFLASFILIMDLLIVMQDWEFPQFQGNMDIKLPGVDTASFYFKLPRFCKKENWHVHITGKWFNYGIIMLVMILDLNMWKNQIFYDPFTFGQYTDEGGYIYSVLDQNFINSANKTLLSHKWRSQNINPMTNKSYVETDPHMNSKYLEYPLALKGIAFIPSIIAFITFGGLIWRYGREEFIVEKVVDDVDKIDSVDGWIIEDVILHEGENDESFCGRDGAEASVDVRCDVHPKHEQCTGEVPSDAKEGTPVLMSVQNVTCV
ncbi:transmembrane protein 117-like [Montipora foliosa]|uniref:transmembrane protein 117-like n=1 Tax=Montipora foliosa TaxID=591990 RepID=UPI0035F210DB